jgi:putative hemolysin
MDSDQFLWGLGFIAGSGLTGMFLLYYATSLPSLNSTQLERMFQLKDKDLLYKGLYLHILITGVRVAALLSEILFFSSIIILWFEQSRNLYAYLLFIGIALIFILFSRIFLPQGFPLKERDTLSSVETLILLFCGYLFFPIAYVLDKVTQSTLRIFFTKTEDERISQAEEAIKSIIDVGETGGIFHQEEGELLQSIVEFSETIVREVMTPRIDLQAIEITETLDAAIKLAVETNYSKIPAYRDRIDDIEGILYSKDLLRYWKKLEPVKLLDIVRPAYFVPENKKVRNLLREFQKDKIHMAIVVDEYGGVAGVVTLEDLLEEIVGEIHDEYDDEEEMIKSIDSSTWLVDAKVDLEELGEILEIEFPENNYETLGGFLFDQLGRVPLAGEIHSYQSIQMEIKEANDRRIVKVIVRRIRPQKRESAEENEQTSNE